MLAHCSLLAWGLLPGRALHAATADGKAASPASPAASAVGGAVGGVSRTRKTILVLGDSLSAEYGLVRGTGWVALLERQLAQDKIAATVVNASVSGDTTSGGRSRLPALLMRYQPSHVVIELGGNDALRGLATPMTRDNLAVMVRAAKHAGAKVMVVGMQLPPNYGVHYGEEFAAMFGQVAADEGTALLPFLLTGVADGPQADRLFQPDRIHPTAEAHPRILANVWAVMKPWLRQ